MLALPAFAAVYHTLEQWVDAGACIPFDWHLLESLYTEGPKPMELVKTCMGESWGKWYGEGDPDPSSIIPHQVATLVFRNLARIELKYDTVMQNEVRKRAEDGIAAIRENAKKRRSA